MAWYLHTLIEA